MPTGTIQSVINLGGVSIASSLSNTAVAQQGGEYPTAAAKAGTLETRVTAALGIVELSTGHGLEVDDIVAVIWSTGYRYGMTVTAVDGNEVTVSGGAGDDFPDNGYGTSSGVGTLAVHVCERTRYDVRFEAGDLEAIAAGSDQVAVLVFTDELSAAYATKIVASGKWEWFDGTGIDNPLTDASVDDVVSVDVYAGATTAATVKLGMLLNA